PHTAGAHRAAHLPGLLLSRQRPHPPGGRPRPRRAPQRLRPRHHGRAPRALRRRPQDRQPRPHHGLQKTWHLRGHPCPPHRRPPWSRPHPLGRRHRTGPPRPPPAPPLDPHQRRPRLLRPDALPPALPPLLHLPRRAHMPPRRRGQAPMTHLTALLTALPPPAPLPLPLPLPDAASAVR